MSGRYEQVEVQVGGMWECHDCGALVADRQLHDQAVHGDWQPTVHDHAPGLDLPPTKVPNRQYTDRGPAPGVYRDPKETA